MCFYSVFNVEWPVNLTNISQLICLVGQEIRERLSGAVEAFARRNGSGHGLPGDHSRHRSSDDVPSSKDVVK